MKQHDTTAARTADRRAILRILRHPGRFALRVATQFRANQGLLLAGAVAYYAMLSLVPLVILMLLALSLLFPEDRLLLVMGEYLELVMPGQAAALVDGVRAFLVHRDVVGVVLGVTMLFFSSLAFTALENAMAVIFFHRVAIKRRHFFISAIMPYLFILFLATGLIIVTVISGMLQAMGAYDVWFLGHSHSLGQLSAQVLYLVGVAGEAVLLSAIYLVMPVGRLSVRHAFAAGALATVLWEITRHLLGWYYATASQIQVVYGTLATAVGVLMSAELGAIVLLAGAQVIAEYERAGRIAR
jgi:membrane protein